jgi:uncharacterized pyridoxal phosphate-containing UPF0001 family protein
LRREKAATAIQAAIRGKLQRKRYQKAYRQVAIVQGLWRVKKAKALLEKLKRKAQALSKVVAAKAALEKKVDVRPLSHCRLPPSHADVAMPSGNGAALRGGE